MISQVNMCDLCMPFDHLLSQNYELMNLPSQILGYPWVNSLVVSLPGGLLAFIEDQGSWTPHHNLYVMVFFFFNKKIEWHMGDYFVRMLLLKKNFLRSKLYNLQWSDSMQAIPAILVDSAISHLLIWIFISMPVVLWLWVVVAVNSWDEMLRTSPTVFKARHSQSYLKKPFITTTLDQCEKQFNRGILLSQPPK